MIVRCAAPVGQYLCAVAHVRPVRAKGVVSCALGWACWTTYVGWPGDGCGSGYAMGLLGNALHYAGRNEDALTVKEAQLSMLRRLGDSENNILACQGNLANTRISSGRHERGLTDRARRTLRMGESCWRRG